jgi:hypothetical protein
MFFEYDSPTPEGESKYNTLDTCKENFTTLSRTPDDLCLLLRIPREMADLGPAIRVEMKLW